MRVKLTATWQKASIYKKKSQLLTEGTRLEVLQQEKGMVNYRKPTRTAVKLHNIIWHFATMSTPPVPWIKSGPGYPQQ